MPQSMPVFSSRLKNGASTIVWNTRCALMGEVHPEHDPAREPIKRAATNAPAMAAPRSLAFSFVAGWVMARRAADDGDGRSASVSAIRLND